jgi:type II secretion system-associated lipoprotein
VTLFVAVPGGACELAFVSVHVSYRVGRVALIFGWALCLLTAACAPALLRETDVQDLNEIYRDRVFVTKADIQPTFSSQENDEEPEVIFQKGTRVKIQVESADDWIRVRATPVEEKREHNPGKVIIYIFRDFLREDGEPEEIQDRYPAERLEQKIVEILDEVAA